MWLKCGNPQSSKHTSSMVGNKQNCQNPSCFKLEAQGPFIAHLITNSKQFRQIKDNQNDRIQINACVVSNTSVCCCEHWVWRRISSKEKPFLNLFLLHPGSTLGISGRNHYQNGSIPSKAFVFEAFLNPSCPALDPPQGRSDKKPKNMCVP